MGEPALRSQFSTAKGRHARPGGKAQFAAVLEWRNRQLADRFSAAVVELIRAAHPNALTRN